ncbi:MAG TPA: DNA mismatch repair endonuclease MutL [Smithella sp.]|nr:DNA mismatch repair endonuclease MutL [Smithella sp.]
MSKRIVILSEEIANKIAAGEVVERPASIVKELVENAIDAGATDIRVELEKGGCQSIKVVDNGSGIEHEDVALVFERHATSKINHFDDIYSVASFGFRGEAMPSIASISRVELLTRRKDDLEGTKAILEAGSIKEISPAGAPAGTQISVTKIFAKVPARRKFLKTEATEQGLCLDAITRLALAHPEIRFKVLVNGRESFTAPEAPDVSGRISMIMGNDFSAHAISVNAQKDNVSLMGFISRPDFSKSNSKSIYLFVNKRFVRDNSITHAVLSAYRQVIEPRRYPAAVLFLDLPPEDVDVNVHPAKMEVRFKDSNGIYQLVSRSIAEHLAGAETAKSSFVYRLAPTVAPKKVDLLLRRKSKKDSSSDVIPVRDKTAPRPFGLFSRQNLQQALSDDLLARAPVAEQPETSYPGDQTPVNEKINFSELSYLGQFANTYLVFAGDEGLILLDQHAAHERILLEKLKKATPKQVVSQSLLILEIISLTPAQISLFSECIDFLREIGLEIEIFGKDAIVVKAIPATLSEIKISELISDIADQLKEQNQMPSLEEKKEKILASLACRAAIKANHVLSEDEVEALCSQLEETPYHLTCPHGRPVTISISLSEIERMFKRK